MKFFNLSHAEYILVLVSRSSSAGLPLICRAARSPAFLIRHLEDFRIFQPVDVAFLKLANDGVNSGGGLLGQVSQTILTLVVERLVESVMVKITCL